MCKRKLKMCIHVQTMNNRMNYRKLIFLKGTDSHKFHTNEIEEYIYTYLQEKNTRIFDNFVEKI